MLARNPADRFATPQAVMQALVPFLNPETPSRYAALRCRTRPNCRAGGCIGC